MVKIKLDPGHGGSDPGAVGNGLQEKALTLIIAKKIGALLNEYEGVEVSYTRTDDRFVSLSDRAAMANRDKVDYFLSIHINAGGGTGFESFTYTSASPQSVAYQNVIHPEIMASIGGKDRGKKRANFAVLRQTNMPAILTENLFIDTAADAANLKSDAFLQKIAQGHVNGLAKGFGLKKKAAPAPKPAPQPTPAPAGDVYYRVITGSFNDRKNAEDRMALLKKAGFESFIDIYKK